MTTLLLSYRNIELREVLHKYYYKSECRFSITIRNIRLENSIKYNNRSLNVLCKLTSNDLIIYWLLVKHKEGLTTGLLVEKLINKETDKSCISKPTRIKNIDTLAKKALLKRWKIIEKRVR